VVYESWN
jgi:hypothetical protein